MKEQRTRHLTSWRTIPVRPQSVASRKVCSIAKIEYVLLRTLLTIAKVQAQGHNIRRYSDYLIIRAKAYADTKIDHVRNGQGRLKRLTVDKGLLRETEVVQRQIKALLKCDVCQLINEIRFAAY